MRLSVILSTYESPGLLERSLAAFSLQGEQEFELLVADDGSSSPTRELIDRVRPELPFVLRHVWHQDRGFRKCRILNRAISESSGDYLLFSDGDCLPAPSFVATHLRLARPGKFLSGGYLKLGREASDLLSLEEVRAGRHADYGWLRRQGARLPWRTRRLGVGGSAAAILDGLTPTKPTWNGHNASGWKSDIVAVNGFDERMGWGGEDREMGERLENLGRRGVQVRHRALCVHLWHERGYVSDDVLQRNLEFRRETARTGSTYTNYGIDQI